MTTPKGKRAVERTTNIRIDKQLQAKLIFLTQLTDKTMSDIIEMLVDEKYPTIQADMEKLEKTKRDITKKYDEGGGK
jgi:hypothetical protein